MPDVHPAIASASWLKRSDLRALVAALDSEGGQCRYVGGAVRDTLCGQEVNDIDMATMLRPETVMQRLHSADIRAVPTGIDHGTVTAVLDGGPVEITTLRHDVSTDGRRATVAYSDNWREDAARRDFTINALYLDPNTLQIEDYFDGQEDLTAGKVRFIGSADQRICEDYLRILRFFRFTARYGTGQPDKQALEACIANVSGLKSLSRERISGELLAILQLPDPIESAALMFRAGIWQVVLPQIAPDGLELLRRVVAREKKSGLHRRALTRLVSLLPKDEKMADEIADSLRFSNAMRKKTRMYLKDMDMGVDDVRMAAYRVGRELALQKLLVFAEQGQFASALQRIQDWQPPAFAISGKDIVAAGISPGPKVSTALREIESKWILADFPDENTQKAICAEVLKTYIN